MSGDFEKKARLFRWETVPEDLRPKVLARAEAEALDPFAASLRVLRPERPAVDLRDRALTTAVREVVSARRARMVQAVAALVVAVCVPVNLLTEGRGRRAKETVSVLHFEAGADSDVLSQEIQRVRRVAALSPPKNGMTFLIESLKARRVFL